MVSEHILGSKVESGQLIGFPSSRFRVKKTIKMVIFSVTLTVTLLVFSSYLTLENGKILFSVGMKVYWPSGEKDIFPKHS